MNTTRTNILKQLILLLIITILGIFSLIATNIVFNNIIERLDSTTKNLEAKIDIGEYIVEDLYKIRSDFYELATTVTNKHGRKLIQKRINRKLNNIRHTLDVLEHGGVLNRIIKLNIAGHHNIIKTIEYAKESEDDVSLEAIDLRPKLKEFEQMLGDVIIMLEKREKYRKNKDEKNYLRHAKRVKRFYKATPAFFVRIIENTRRLLFEGEESLQILKNKIEKEKTNYILLELTLIAAIIIIMLSLGYLIAKQINKHNKRLLFLNDELNSNVKELQSQKASVRGLLDAQPNIIVVSNGEEMIDANQALIEFFPNYYSFDDFKSKHACICDYFEDIGNPEYILDIDYPEGMWFEHILAHPERVHKVAMQGEKRLHYFTITASKKEISEENFWIIISLNDITKELEANKQLKQVNDNLAILVRAKTQKLQDLNENLAIKIKNEVKKNREKDKRMIQQSRYAALGEMIGNIAHQWRQPLSAILSTSSSMQLQLELELAQKEDIKKSFENITKYVNFLNQTIEDFRAFFKKDKKLSDFDMRETLDNSMNIVNALYKDNSIEVTISHDNTPLISKGFPNELAQAYINILNNAKDALIEKDIPNKHVFIQLFREDEYNIITISDNAGGIPQEIIPKIFDPYFTTKHQSQGTGIGLYMSKYIVEKHMNGLLSVQNQSFEIKGESYYGACFKIALPIISNPN